MLGPSYERMVSKSAGTLAVVLIDVVAERNVPLPLKPSLRVPFEPPPSITPGRPIDTYFSADVETDGPIPGPYSMLSFAMVYAGRYDGHRFERPADYAQSFYCELRPISTSFEAEALAVNGLDRDRLVLEGVKPEDAMTHASEWIRSVGGTTRPILVAYPLSFDWSWLYWYFVHFSTRGSPFSHSGCFDMKTAYAVKARLPVSQAGRSNLLPSLRSNRPHTHHALDDAIEQAEIFANLCEWEGVHGNGTIEPPR
jgi:hypothetical protein